MDASTVWIAIGSCATGLMAIATFGSILYNWCSSRKKDRMNDVEELKRLISRLQEILNAFESGKANLNARTLNAFDTSFEEHRVEFKAVVSSLNIALERFPWKKLSGYMKDLNDKLDIFEYDTLAKYNDILEANIQQKQNKFMKNIKETRDILNKLLLELYCPSKRGIKASNIPQHL